MFFFGKRKFAARALTSSQTSSDAIDEEDAKKTFWLLPITGIGAFRENLSVARNFRAFGPIHSIRIYYGFQSIVDHCCAPTSNAVGTRIKDRINLGLHPTFIRCNVARPEPFRLCFCQYNNWTPTHSLRRIIMRAHSLLSLFLLERMETFFAYFIVTVRVFSLCHPFRWIHSFNRKLGLPPFYRSWPEPACLFVCVRYEREKKKWQLR